MKTFKLTYLIIILFTGILSVQTSCAQLTLAGKAAKAYSVGNYDLAVRYAVEALRKKPKKKKAQEVIVPAYKAAMGNYEDQIMELKAMSSDFKGEETVQQRRKVVELYKKAISLQKEVKSLPPITPKRANEPLKFEIKNYYGELADAKNNLDAGKNDAAEKHYQNALRLMEDEDDVEGNKKAAKEFKVAMQYVPNYKDSKSMYEKARKAGTSRIAIIPFVNKSGKYGYGAVGEIQSDLIISTILDNKQATEFLEIITRDQLDEVLKEQKLNDLGIIDDNSLVEVGKILGVHEILTGKINQIAINYPQTVSRSFHDKSRVVVDRKTYVENGKKKTKNIYGDVHARVTEYTKQATAKINGSYRIIDIKTARIKQSKTFTEDYKFNCSWGKYSGDERALSYSSKLLCRKKEEVAPSREEMVSKVAEELAIKIANNIINYTK